MMIMSLHVAGTLPTLAAAPVRRAQSEVTA